MQIIFIHHSCFLAEIDRRVLIFDYVGGDAVSGYHFTGKLPTYEPDTELIVFASHGHKDHFDPQILGMAEDYPNIRYVLSKDIRIRKRKLKDWGIDPGVLERVVFVGADKELELDECLGTTRPSADAGGGTQTEASAPVRIRTLRSSEQGVAFYVEAGGISLFHAGDLGDWSMEHVGDLINGRCRRDYRRQIRKLIGQPINVAFVPMDPRLGSHQWDSMDYFLKNTDAEYVFPMHMWQDYSGIAAYKKRLSNRTYADRLLETKRENQVFLFGEERD